MSTPNRTRAGLLYAIGAYAIWGLFPLYFAALMPANPFEIVSFRVIVSLLFACLLITLLRQWGQIWDALRNKRVVLLLALAAVLIFINWEVFILAVYANKVVETALGYFINPLLTVALGVFFFAEKLRTLQWVAVGLGLVSVVVLTVAYGQPPIIALTLAISFGLYGLVKKKVGADVGAIPGLAIETAWVLPIAVVQLIVVGVLGQLDVFTLGPTHAILTLGSGVVTALPLMLFASGTKRIPLSWVGLIQYFSPFASFLLGIFVFHEAMSTGRWIGFGIIWLAIVLLSIDVIVNRRSRSRLLEAEETAIGG
ncbi:MAG: hypothetical protein RLZZ600_1241 [Actinomycetota bacterium]|jgi:chloramphenicol-sensitive protein RarD